MKLSWAKEFDKKNRYWLKVFKIMPKGLQEQIMFASPFVSAGIIIWIMAGRSSEDIKNRSSIINHYEEKIKKKARTDQS